MIKFRQGEGARRNGEPPDGQRLTNGLLSVGLGVRKGDVRSGPEGLGGGIHLSMSTRAGLAPGRKPPAGGLGASGIVYA